MVTKLTNKLISSKVSVNKTGEVLTVTGYTDSSDFSNAIITCDNGKSYGLQFVYEKGLISFNDEIIELIKAEIEADAAAKAERDRLEDEMIQERRDAAHELNKKQMVMPNEKDLDNYVCWFSGDYSFLSNMFSAPVEYEGITFKSAESAIQAQRDPSRLKEFTELDGFHAWQEGLKFSPRADWDKMKLRIALNIVRAKFRQNKDLGEKLLKTGNLQLVNGSCFGETFWGVCRGKGHNYLGRILMRVRDELRQDSMMNSAHCNMLSSQHQSAERL